MKKKIITTAILSALSIAFTLTAIFTPFKAKTVNAEQERPTVSQQIQLIKSDYKFTQDQKMSRIKAEYLIENKGYQDSDELVVIVGLSDGSAIDNYLKNTDKYKSVADYLKSPEGMAFTYYNSLRQDALVSSLKERGLITDEVCRYSTVTNAVAVKTTYGKMASIKGVSSVSSVMMSDTYNMPKSTSADGSTVVNAVDIYPTGIYNSASVNFTGKGTAVAILDSGFDLSHEVFQRNLNDGEILYTKSDIESLYVDTNAYKHTKNLQLYNIYHTNKIPFAYDYADKDYDVFPYDSEHGTHVAGIIGGKSDTITGIAIDTQLVLMKVFPDLDEGGKTEDILLALEDCVTLGVDAINMSLGSSCGFAREEDNDNLNKVYDAIGQAGISLITAASNDYSSAFGGDQGNTNKVYNPDSGTVGSPSTYSSALSVASISGTKSNYIIANDDMVFFYKESNSMAGLPNDFYGELKTALKDNGYTDAMLKQEVVLNYVTIPGVGMSVNFENLDLSGKIALIRRGDNTFEEKAANAKKAGAIACIIYNNIDGDILMSMGKSDHIPTVSISKDDGYTLAQYDEGKMKFNFNSDTEGGYLAGPFMSDFSSWGPMPSLEMKPEITAHGGNILSSVPNGGYEELSGTSMATPNLCGIVVLIRQYLKEKYPSLSWSEINNMANQLLMSTATIVRNEEGNPYSPRKQGAGLASLFNVVNSSGYLTVDGIDRTKLELGDDRERTGVYTMEFNLVNISGSTKTYDLSTVVMTESVSTSDKSFVSETPHILDGDCTYSVLSGEGNLNGNTVSVNANKSVKIKVVCVLSDSDKEYIDSRFPYGMYVEGFVKLTAKEQDEIDLNVPFLAFYGDWTEAPLFDKTYYEVETEAHNKAIDDEDKIKADYFATTPYGSYFYNYIIPLGTYLYDMDEEAYDAIPASYEHMAVSDTLGCIDGIGAIYAGLLRGAKTITYKITDKATGEVIYDKVVYNASKAHYSGMAYPYYEDIRFKSYPNGLVNNHEYEFSMVGTLDYGDGGIDTNVKNSFNFTFTMDDEAPIIKSAVYSKTYDKSLKKDRYYLTLTVYDNHYVQSVAPIIFTSSSSYTYLSDNPIPVYSQKGQDTTLKIEITDYLEDIYKDEIITSSLALVVDDYALNSNIFLCQLPGTDGDFKFTTNGEDEGSDLIILSVYEDDVVDLRNYLATTDEDTDEAKDYLKHLVWTSSNDKIVEVEEGLIKGIKAGKATITVKEQMDLRQAVLIVNVKEKPEGERQISTPTVDNVENATMESVRFAYFDTVFAYSRAAQTSEIGATGDRFFTVAKHGASFYPGEKIKLGLDVNPWYVRDKYEFEFESTNPTVASVDEDGVVTALKEGSATISAKTANSNLRATFRVTVKSEFVIENRTLVAYKGLGGDVVIPDDEGILYIGAYSFCLYNTDNYIEVTEEDYDANKIPASNTTVTSVVIPEGVEDIQKYAFYNCTGLKTVVIPTSVKFIREYCFYGDVELKRVVLSDAVVKDTDSDAQSYFDSDNKIKTNKHYLTKDGDLVIKNGNTLKSFENAEKLEVIGARAFYNCEKFENVDLSNVYAIGIGAFDSCKSITYLDLSSLRNTGAQAFQRCTALETVTLDKNTKLSYAMFARSGLTSVVIDNSECDIPTFCFASCEKLESVTINNYIVEICEGAFSECTSLNKVDIKSKVDIIGAQAFYGCTALEEITLPNNEVKIGTYAFYRSEKLKTVKLGKDTKIVQDGKIITSSVATADENAVVAGINGYLFAETALEKFVVDALNPYYSVSDDGNLLLSKDGTTLILAVTGKDLGDYTLPSTITEIAEGGFSGAKITKLTIAENGVKVGAYAFAVCDLLEEVNLASGVIIGNYAFYDAKALATVNGMENATVIGNYAFCGTDIASANIGDNAIVGEGAFLRTNITTATIGKNATFGLGAFQDCKKLITVNMHADGGIHFGQGCFANDSALKNIDLSKVGESIEPETFYACTSLMTANLTNVKYIGRHAFADCGSLAVVNVPSVITIGDGAFMLYGTYATAPIITEIDLPDTLTEIGEAAFFQCEKLTKITIPSSVTEIKDYTFAKCKLLEKVELGDGVRKIGEYAFRGCELLKNINLGKVQEIEGYAFTSCYSLQSVDLQSAVKVGECAFDETSLTGNITANKLESAGDSAFRNCDILSFTAEKLSKIGEACFAGNKNLETFDISKDLSFIGDGAFFGAEKLETFTFDKSKTDGEINGYAKLDKGILYTKLKNGKYQLAEVPGGMNLPVLKVADGTYRIAYFAGGENKYVTGIILPDSLRYIGNYAFYGYDNLTTVEFKSVNAPILEDNYDEETVLPETAVGFDLLHNQYDLFGLELYYYTFVGLVGEKEPLKMVIPENTNGYNSTVYTAYFGKVEDAEKNSYTAMENSMITFIEKAEKLAEKQAVNLSDEILVSEALASYNNISQDFSAYGITPAKWYEMVETVENAKNRIIEIKVTSASNEVKYLREVLPSLNVNFDITRIDELKRLTETVNNLTVEETTFVDLTNYNALVESYNDYLMVLNGDCEFYKYAISDTVTAIPVETKIVYTTLSVILFAIIKKLFCGVI